MANQPPYQPQPNKPQPVQPASPIAPVHPAPAASVYRGANQPAPLVPAPSPHSYPAPVIADPARAERDRYLLEVLNTTLHTVERVTKRMDRESSEDRQTLDKMLHELRQIAHDLNPPAPPPPNQSVLTSIKIQFSKGTKPMANPVAGPVTLTTAGQQATASVLGFDQFGNSWTGTIPPVSYSIDNPGVATSTPNSDGLTDVVAAVANGVANLTASLTTAEGLALSDTEAITVALASAPPPPTPVLSSIKVAFAS